MPTRGPFGRGGPPGGTTQKVTGSSWVAALTVTWQCATFGRSVVADLQPEGVEQRSCLRVGQPRQVDRGDWQRVEHRKIWNSDFQSSDLVGEPFRVGAQLGEAGVDVADEVTGRVVGKLQGPHQALAPGGDVVLLPPDALDLLLPSPVA